MNTIKKYNIKTKKRSRNSKNIVTYKITIHKQEEGYKKNIIMQQKTNYSKGEYCFRNIHCFLLVVGESSSSYSSLNSPRSFSDGSSRIFPPLIYRLVVFIYIIFIMSEPPHLPSLIAYNNTR